MTASGGDRSLVIRAPRVAERDRIGQLLRAAWGSTTVMSRGRAHDASLLPALLAMRADEIVGLATYRPEASDCELVTLDAFLQGEGIGSALLDRVRQEAIRHGCKRLWLITTNDNLQAIRFYQRRGLRLVALHRGAVDDARLLKPSITKIGDHGIPIHDELELELELR
jgi:GNAT superfamily N-acetyltransferase